MASTKIDAQKLLTRITELQNFWKARDDKVLDEREFLNLPQPKVPKKGFVSIVSNEARTFFNTSVALISMFPPKFKLPGMVSTESEKAQKNKLERFAAGVYHEVDSGQMDLGKDAWIRELAWYVCGGLFAVFPHIDDEGDDNPGFRWDIYDPITCYPLWANNRLVELARVYYTNSDAALRMAEDNGWVVPKISSNLYDSDNVKIASYFFIEKDEEVYHTVFINDEVSKDLTREEQFKGKIPVIIGSVAGSPARSLGTSDKDWVKASFRSVIEDNRGMYEQKNRLMSLMMQIVQDTAYRTIIDVTRTGTGKLKPEDMGSGAIIHRQVGEPIDTLLHAVTPIEVNNLLGLINRDIQKGAIPDSSYGSIPFEVSGYALSQLMAAVKYKLNPYRTAMNRVISRCALQTIDLYREGGYKPINLTVYDQKGRYYFESFDPEVDLPHARFIDVDVPFALALDKVQTMAAARQAMVPPQILSRETLWEDWDLGVDDKDLEFERILNDQMMELPLMKLIHTVEKMHESADRYAAEGKTKLAEGIRKYAMQFEKQIEATIAGGQPAAEAKPAAELPPGGAISPEQLGMSRAAERVALGGTPPGLVRRPQTPEERAERK